MLEENDCFSQTSTFTFNDYLGVLEQHVKYVLLEELEKCVNFFFFLAINSNCNIVFQFLYMSVVDRFMNEMLNLDDFIFYFIFSTYCMISFI